MLKRLLPFIILIAGVSVAEGQTYGWRELSDFGYGGLNEISRGYPTSNITSIAFDTSNYIYVAGLFMDAGGYPDVLNWTGSIYSIVAYTDVPPYPSYFSTIGSDKSGDIYAGWSYHGLQGEVSFFVYEELPVPFQYQLGWIQLGQPSDFDSTILTLYPDEAGNLYAGGSFTDSNHYFYVSKWDGSSWTEVGTGLNALNATNNIVSICEDSTGNIYALIGSSDYCVKGSVYKWNGVNWRLISSGIDSLPNFEVAAICNDNAGNIYACGSIDTGGPTGYSVIAAKWNDSTWSKIGVFQSNGDTLNPFTNGICSDGNGNIYVSGAYLTNDSLSPFVSLWNGVTWNDLTIDRNAFTIRAPLTSITGLTTSCICVDGENNLYACGPFVDSSGNNYVAEYCKIVSVTMQNSPRACNGSNVILNPLVLGYFPPYNYRWLVISGDSINCDTCQNPKAFLTQNSTYFLLVTDVKGDTATTSFTFMLDTAINQFQLTCNNQYISCNSDSVLIEVAGANYPCNISWGDGSDSGDIRVPISYHNYNVGNDYLITVKDSTGCVSSLFDTASILEVGLLENANLGCAGLGQLDAAGYYGPRPYHYLWSNGDTTSLITNLAEGNYELTITDSSGCNVSATYNIEHVYYYTFIQSTDANCGNNGSLQTIVTGGTSPFNYSWSNGDTTAGLSNLGSGNYTLTITDSTGCETTGYGIVNRYCATIISGTVFIDTTGTCEYNGTQPPVPNVTLTLSGGAETQYATTDNNGNYSFTEPDTGTFHLYVQNSSSCGNYTLCGNATQTIHASGLGDSSINNNFAFKPDSASFDLFIHPGWTPGYPGFEKDYWIYFGNESPIPYNGPVTVAFKYDSNLVFLSSDIPYTTYNSLKDSITWLVTNFDNSTWDRFGDIRFKVPDSLALTYQLHSQFWIFPYSGDCDTSNNYLNYYDPVKSSHDPNAKTVSPNGVITNSDSVLTYTIYYQNTGTDSTYFIIIKDTLSPYLNPATVQNLAGTDKYSSFTISGNDILTWIFNPLRLVDSATNPTASKGFIVYSVKPWANTPVGTHIDNSASIYFDYNPPIVTDTIMSDFCSSTVTSLSASICNGEIYPVGFVTHSQTGNFMDTIQNINGCDSIVSLRLTVLQSSSASINTSICNGESYYVGNIAHNQAGNYIDTIQNINGCDSIVSLQLTVLPLSSSNINTSICNGQSYPVGNSTYTLPGNYSDTLQNINGCDSIVSLQLTVLPSSSENINAGICKGETYPVGNIVYSQAGIYTDTLQNSYGCDSIVSLQLSVDTLTAQLTQPSPDTLIVTASGNISWLDCGNNQLVEGAVSNTFVPQTSGTYAAIVSSGNCSDTTDCATAVVNGIQAISNAHVHIYPNPTNNLLNIVLSQSAAHTVTLYDMKGALLSSYHYQGSFEQLDLSRYSDGVYFIAINADEWFVRQKVVKIGP